MTQFNDYAPEVQRSLEVARTLVQLGVPIFLLEPTDDPKFKTGYRPPKNWQNTAPDASVINRWEPGMALAAVCGHTFDVIDVDPRNGGDISALDGAMPTVYARAKTPSGGDHFWIKALGLSKDKINSGIDYQGGSFTPNASGSYGRGFVFIPPTERNSKVDGQRYSYSWTQLIPDAITQQYVADESGQTLSDHIIANKKQKQIEKQTERPAGGDSIADRIGRWMSEGIHIRGPQQNTNGTQREALRDIVWDSVINGEHKNVTKVKWDAAVRVSPLYDKNNPWTDSDFDNEYESAINKLIGEGYSFNRTEAWMLECALDMQHRSDEDYGLYPNLPKETIRKTTDELARRRARDIANAKEAERNWRGWDEDCSLGQALAEAPEQLDYMFGTVGTKDDNLLLAAKFKTGKTTMLGTFIKAILDGDRLLGEWEVADDVADMAVGIWNCEMTKQGFIDYLKKSGIQNGDRARLRNLRGVAVPFRHNPLAREKTVEWLSDNGIQIWIIDSWSKICAWNNVDMNDNSEVMQ
ncbi:MAG TPA: AAA family ATPase, partial [Terriglobia bacterium]|nr:AAA family ATPase [Terriglobia bacterium]